MKKYPQLNKDAIIGIETRRKDDGLQCYFCSKTYVTQMAITPDTIGKSFNLPML